MQSLQGRARSTRAGGGSHGGRNFPLLQAIEEAHDTRDGLYLHLQIMEEIVLAFSVLFELRVANLAQKVAQDFSSLSAVQNKVEFVVRRIPA